MTRRYWIFCALAWSGCHKAPLPGDSLLPAVVAGAWRRTALRQLPPELPGVERAFEGVYAGTGQIIVDLCETKVSGTAFEMTQHWREAPDTVFFDKGRYFVVVKWEQADRQALTAFVRELEKRLAAVN